MVRFKVAPPAPGMNAPLKNHWYVTGCVPVAMTLKTAVPFTVTVRLVGWMAMAGAMDVPNGVRFW